VTKIKSISSFRSSASQPNHASICYGSRRGGPDGIGVGGHGDVDEDVVLHGLVGGFGHGGQVQA